VLNFYNQRRRQLKEVAPNAAHLYLKKLEEIYEVVIITQNVDDLHERAGSSNIIHLHGELRKVRSERNEDLIYEWDKDVNLGDLAEDRAQLRPYIVWFGEMVPLLDKAAEEVMGADILLVIVTSLQVLPVYYLFYYFDYVKPVLITAHHTIPVH